MKSPHDDQSDQTEMVQPGLNPSQTGKPKQSDPSTDPQPGQKKDIGKPDYRPNN